MAVNELMALVADSQQIKQLFAKKPGIAQVVHGVHRLKFAALTDAATPLADGSLE
jgi:hypothetical protein